MEVDKSKVVAPLLLVAAVAVLSWNAYRSSNQNNNTLDDNSNRNKSTATTDSLARRVREMFSKEPKKEVVKKLHTFPSTHKDTDAPRNLDVLSFRSDEEGTSGSMEPSIRLSIDALVNRGVTSHSRERFTSSRTMVQVGALTVRVTRNFTEEPLPYRFPIEHKCFVHEDGSRLDIMAEDLSAVEAPLNSEEYAKLSVDRVKTVAEKNRTYFKEKACTPASTVLTTIMEHYICIHLGPSPVIVVAFILVSNHKAYTVQLQCQTDEYETRLGDLIACVHSARLLSGDVQLTGRGCNVFTYPSGKTVYEIRVPVPLLVTSPREGELHLRYRYDGSKTWKGVITSANRNPLQEEDEKQCMSLADGKLFLYIFFDFNELDKKTKREVDVLIETIVAAPQKSASIAPHYYESKELTIPLPDLSTYAVNVCEHDNDTFATLFITELSSGKLYEMELHITAIPDEHIEQFILFIDSLFLTAARPSLVTNAAGQECISADGVTTTGDEAMLVLNTVRVTGDHWLVIRWLYSGCDPLPRPLERYKEHLLEGVMLHK